MGEIADMMLEGDLCECCGVALHSDKTPGHPMYCSTECAKDLYESYVAGRHDGHAAIIALMGMKNVHLANFQPINGPELVVDNEKAK